MSSGKTTPAILPVDNPTLPIWRTQLHQLDEHRTTPDLPNESDIIIIGAGYAGVSIAYHLLTSDGLHQSNPSITVLEARQVCSGATGRNGGHLRPDLYGRTPRYIDRHGVEAAAELVNFELAHVKAIKDVVAKEQIDCDLNITRNMNVYMDEKQAAKVKGEYDALAARGLSFIDDIHWSVEKDAEWVSGVKGAKACFSFTSGTLWPYKLILGLLERVLETGAVSLQTSTPVTWVTSDGPESHTVHTPRGTIHTKKVVYATNAYSSGLLPEYFASIVPCRGLACHIAVPEGQTPPFLPYSYALRPETDGVDYLISQPDGSIVVGGAHQTFKTDKKKWYNTVDDSTLIEPTKTYFDGYMQRTFKGWENSGAYVKEIWTGVMGYSYDSAAHVGEIPSRPGQYICAGFNGHGMPVIYLSAKGLAEMIREDKKYEDVYLPRIFKTTAERLEAARIGKEGGDII